MTVFALSWGTTALGYGRETFLLMQLFGILFFALCISVRTLLAERGRRRALLWVTLAIGAFGLILAPMLLAGTVGAVLTLVVGLSLMGLTYGPLGTVLSELFPTSVRYTGSSLTFNFAGIFGASRFVCAPYPRQELWTGVRRLLPLRGGSADPDRTARHARNQRRPALTQSPETPRPVTCRVVCLNEPPDHLGPTARRANARDGARVPRHPRAAPRRRCSGRRMAAPATAVLKSRRDNPGSLRLARVIPDPAKCRVDAAECLRRPLEEREVDGCLAAGLGVIADVTHLGRSAGAPDTLPALHILVDLMPAVLQELREFCPSHVGHVVQSPS